MPSDHTEKAFESAIEEHLLTVGGYLKADPEAFDVSNKVCWEVKEVQVYA